LPVLRDKIQDKAFLMAKHSAEKDETIRGKAADDFKSILGM